MRVSTLIATEDAAYTGHISEYISEYHADTIEISVCNTAQQLRETLAARRYDVALLDEALAKEADLEAINLPMLLWAGSAAEGAQTPAQTPTVTRRIRKHRRISSTVADILEQYAAQTGKVQVAGEKKGHVTAVWSPSGGVGKTTVALAYATSKVLKEKEAFYLNLESFASTDAHFIEKGRSISSVFEMLDSNEGNVAMLVQGTCGCENGLKFLGAPDNYDDVCILSPENIRELVTCCAEITDELVIDLSCSCDARVRQAFELADKILLVTEHADTAKTKLAQFVSQSDVYQGIKDKVTLVVNKTELLTDADKSLKTEAFQGSVVFLPHVKANDEQLVCKALAKSDFGG